MPHVERTNKSRLAGSIKETRTVLLALLSSVSLLAGCELFQLGGPGGGGNPVGSAGTEGDPTLGAKIFSENFCGACHGDDGSGGFGPDIRWANVETLDEQLRPSESSHFGGVFGFLTDEDLRNLDAFLDPGPPWIPNETVPEERIHVVPMGSNGILHAEGFALPLANCTPCHMPNLAGNEFAPSCTSCHPPLWSATGGGPFLPHTEPKGSEDILHFKGFADPAANCSACHGANLEGSGSRPSCTACHDQLWPGAGVPSNHVIALGDPAVLHRDDLFGPDTNCAACHGANLEGAGTVPTCYSCHGPLWAGGGPPPTHTSVLSSGDVTGSHADGRYDPALNCAECHQPDLLGLYQVPACYSCHGQLWVGGGAPPTHTENSTVGTISGDHLPGRFDPDLNCAACHGPDLFGTSLIPACWSCHGSIWDSGPDYPPTHTTAIFGFFHHDPRLDTPVGVCDECHGPGLQGTPLIPSCFTCHGVKWE